MPQPVIYLRNRQDSQFCDATAKVKRYERTPRGWNIWFHTNPDSPYTYSPERVRVLNAPPQDSKELQEFFSPRSDESQHEYLLRYFIEFCYSQKDSSEEVELDTVPRNISPYDLVANGLISTPVEGALQAYLSRTNKSHPDHNTFIFPFGCNASQHTAVRQALDNQISIIQGPPGTGKTQTILNLIANLLLRGKTVAVVSNNNSAVANVHEKLQSQSLDWLVAPLGRTELRNLFFSDGQSQIPSFESQPEDTRQILKLLKQEQKEVAQLFKLQTELHQLQLQLSQTRHELEVFIQEHSEQSELLQQLSETLFDAKSSHQLIRLKDFLGSHFDRVRWYQLPTRLRYYFMGVKHPNRLIAYGRMAYHALNIATYYHLISETEQQISSCEENIKRISPSLLDSYQQHSFTLLQESLRKRFANVKDTHFDAGGYRSQFEAFLQRYPIVLSSTFSLRTSCGNKRFDYLIIDEASQVTIPTAALCFALADNAVIVGDSRQLPHIVSPDSLATRELFPKAYDALRHSVLTSVTSLYGSRMPTTLLREHYRCHPLIIDFCNRRFYDNQMIVMTSHEQPFPFYFINVAAGRIQHQGESIYNQRQLLETEELVRELNAQGITPDSIGVIAPYRAHANRISSVTADTVHRYQGRECDVIIYDTVLETATRFNDDPRLINVAVSRAKKQLYLIGSEQILQQQDSNLAALLNYIRYYDPTARYTRQSPRCSIFDVLYTRTSDYTQILAHRKGNESPAETLFRQLLERELSASPFAGWTFTQEYYLIDLVRSSLPQQQLFADEWNLILHGSRLDFLIFDSIQHQPILAIEVDGLQHLDGKQLQRDNLKDSILRKLGIPILRFATNSPQGQEAQRLHRELLRLHSLRNPQYQRYPLASTHQTI